MAIDDDDDDDDDVDVDANVICSWSLSEQNQSTNRRLQPMTTPLQITWTNMAASLIPRTSPRQSIIVTYFLHLRHRVKT